MKKLLALSFSILSCFAFSQKVNIDSLSKIWGNTKLADTTRLNAIDKIIANYVDNDPDSVLYYYEIKHSFAVKINNKRAIIESLGGMGSNYYSIGDNKKALDYLDKALKLSIETKDSLSIADVNNSLGNVYIDMYYLQKSLNCYLTALRINEKRNDFERVAICNMNIGNIYYTQKNWTRSLYYYNIDLD